MALRKTLLATGEIYHVFNHSVAGIPIFKGARENNLFIESMRFYLQAKPPTKFSIYRQSRRTFPLNLKEKWATIINFCLMPNHFHLLLRQEKGDGIKNFLQRVLGSFAHYFSLKNKFRGHVFEGNFKAVRVENEEQLLHLSRYIHLNPVTAYLVENPEEYPYSSYKIYLGEESSDFVDPSPVLQNFSSPDKYREFLLDQRDHQRTLEKIKHLLLE